MKRRKKIYVIIFIICILIIMFIISSTRYIFLQQDILFFQFFNSIHSSNDNKTKQQLQTENKDIVKQNIEQNHHDILQVQFQLKEQVIQTKNLNLFESISSKTLVNEKIAPGTSGSFDILLNSRETLNYEIIFESQNEKPSNLQFFIENNKKYRTLEALDDMLKGKIIKGERKKVCINWEWCYEQNEENNKKDTIEAKAIRKYQFLIYVKSY